MLASLLAAALICAAAVLVGEAIARTLGLDRWRPYSPAVGLAVTIVVALLAVKLPGHGSAGAIALAVLAVAAAVVVLRDGAPPRPGWDVVALTSLTTLAACLPYISNGRFGIIGLSFNNDLSMHLPWTLDLQDPGAPFAFEATAGYPLGAHSLAAALSSATGIDVESTFAAVLLVVPILLGWVALSLLDGLSRPRRLLGALLTAVAYTVSAFYVQASFKELLLTLFLVAMVAAARDAARRGDKLVRRGVQLGALAAGIVVSFSYGGLAWVVLATGFWAALAFGDRFLRTPGALSRRLCAALTPLRRALPAALAGAATSVLLVAADLPRVLDSLKLFGSSPSGTGVLPASNIGHLVGPVSKREIFGFWPRDDFRYGIDDTLLNEALVALAVLVAAYGLVWWVLRRDLALPAAVLAALAISLYLSERESVYTASKALAPAGALTMALSTRALLGRSPAAWRRAVRVALAVVATAFAAGALWSSYLVLSGARVGPSDHPDELAELQTTVAGQPTLFLGNDDFIRTFLPDVPVVARQISRLEREVATDGAFGFDSLTPAELDSVRFAIAPRTRYRSEPPASFRRIRSTRSFELWERRGATPRRRALSEGLDPGTVLDCSTPAARQLLARDGWARVWPVPPRRARFPLRRRVIPVGDSQRLGIDLPPGRWELSLEYNSSQPVDVRIGGRETTMPANLDRGGPYWAVGEVRSGGHGSAGRLHLRVHDDPLGANTHFAVVHGIAAVRSDVAPVLVPLRRACGRYVDWYALGPARPAVPGAARR